jgi:hypothetical protein
MEGPGKQYPYETTGGLEPGRFKPIAEQGAVERAPAVLTGLEKVWVTVDKVGIPTFGLEGTGSARQPTLALLQKAQGYWRRRTWLGYLPTILKDWAQTHPKNNPDPLC